jgi:hypothetical protein
MRQMLPAAAAILLVVLHCCPALAALSTSETLTCPVTMFERNLTCPAPVLSNITEPPFVNGSWTINKYNKSWDVEWYAEYNKSIDGTGHCGTDINPNNYFTRDCNWTLQCNIPNVTNGSVAFYNFTVDLSTPIFRADTTVFMHMSFYRDMNISSVAPERMFTMNVPIQSYKVAGETHNYVFPSKSKGLIPNVRLGDPYILTANWRELAYVNVSFYTDNNSDQFAQAQLNDIGITLKMHFECDQFFINVTVYKDPDILGLALGIPFALIALIILLAILKWKFPNMCDCCCKKKDDGNDDFENDEAILAAARARREGRDLSKPLVELQDKAGMQTWLDQAEDVVEDLNKNCIYLEEAKTDSQMNKGFDALERASGNPALGAHRDGFVGGRQLYAAGAASGGVKLVDHRPTMKTKGVDDDVVL